MFCTQCGTEFDAYSTACLGCGKPRVAVPPPLSLPAEPRPVIPAPVDQPAAGHSAAEFDEHAATYDAQHASSIRLSGEDPSYFSEYKVTDDGLPNPPAAVSTAWTKVSGPGTVTSRIAAAATATHQPAL